MARELLGYSDKQLTRALKQGALTEIKVQEGSAGPIRCFEYQWCLSQNACQG